MFPLIQRISFQLLLRVVQREGRKAPRFRLRNRGAPRCANDAKTVTNRSQRRASRQRRRPPARRAQKRSAMATALNSAEALLTVS